MKEAQSEPVDTERFLGAVRLNWRLWTIFQAEIGSPDSPLPLEMRQNMLSLANFVDKTSVDIIAEPKPEKVNILITINRELAAGLFATPPADAAQTAATVGAEAPMAPATGGGTVDSSA